MSDIKFNCVFDGESIEEVFAVKLPLDRFVNDLKEEIKKRNENSLRNVDNCHLVVWKLSNPLLTDDLATMFGEQVDIRKVLNAPGIPSLVLLKPMNKLSYYFTETPVEEKLHLIVKAPSPGTTISPSSSAGLGAHATVLLINPVPTTYAVLGLFALPQYFRAVGEPPEELVGFHRKIWNKRSAHETVFVTTEVTRDGPLIDDVNVPSHCCVMSPPHIYSSDEISGILIRNEYVQAIKDVVAFYKDGKFPDNNEADMAMYSGDVGLDGDTVMGTSVHVAEFSVAPTPFPSTIDNPFLDTKFPPRRGSAVVVTGTPGIGKSVLLDVILHLRSLAGCDTIFVQNRHYADIFTASGVSRVSRHKITKLGPSTWVLVDSDTDMTGVPQWVIRLGCFVVQAASPRSEHMEWMKKKGGRVSRYFLKPWSLEEALAARMLHTIPTPSEAELKVFFERYIPSARAAYGNASSIPDYDDTLVTRVSNLSAQDVINIALKSVSLEIDNMLPHHIFVILPGRTRSQHVIAFVSRYCLDTLVANVKKEKVANVADELFQVFIRNAHTRSAAGQLLDSVVSDIFT